MGNKRKLNYLLGGLVTTVTVVAAWGTTFGPTQALAQNVYRSPDRAAVQNFNHQNFGDQAAQRAYYQSQSNSDYGRHQATAYRDTTYVAPQNGHYTQRPAPRPAAPTQRSFGPQRRFNKVGFGPRQDDPFGEDQGTDPFGESTPRSNSFDPFADPPPSSRQEDPFGEEQMAPGANGNQLTDPFADPPGVVPPRQDIETREPIRRPQRPQRPETQQRGVDPVLPGDADPNLDSPSLNGSSVLEGNREDYPPGTVKPDDDELTDPFKDPQNQRVYDENRYIPPAGIYRPPGSRRQQAYQDPYRQPANPQPHQQQYQQPVYQPAYQPIPAQAPSHPPVYAPPAQQLVTAPPPTMPAPAVESAYIPTVAPVNPCDTCQDCQSGCNNGCGGACLGCDTNRCPNFYFGLFGGWTSLGELTSNSGLGEFQTEDGTAFGIALGRRNGRNLRTELEFSTRSNDVTGFFDGSTLTSLSGDITSYAGMANVYWEVIDVPTRFLKPYVGIGAGFISIDSDIRDSSSRSILSPEEQNDTSLALQYMVGINYKAYRNVDLFAEYRYLRADTFRLDTTLGTSGRYPYQSDNVFVGLRWKF